MSYYRRHEGEGKGRCSLAAKCRRSEGCEGCEGVKGVKGVKGVRDEGEDCVRGARPLSLAAK